MYIPNIIHVGILQDGGLSLHCGKDAPVLLAMQNCYKVAI